MSQLLRVVVLIAAFGAYASPVSAATADTTDHGPYFAHVATWDANYADAHYRAMDSGTLAWGEAYILRAFMAAYRLTADPYWLGRVADHADSILANARDIPAEGVYDSVYADGRRGWGTGTYSDQGYDEYMVHDGHFCTPIAAYTAEVHNNPDLWDEFGARATAHFDTLLTHVVNKWLNVLKADRGTGITLREFGGFEHMPHNQYAAFGSLLLFVDDTITSPRWMALHPVTPGNEVSYLPWAIEMGAFFKDDLRIDADDAYRWGYWPGGGSEDISHANLTLEFAWHLHERGLVFDTTDVRRFANTMTRAMWNGDLVDVGLNKYNTAGDDFVWTSYTWGWSLFTAADPLLWHVLNNDFRHKANITSPYQLTAALRLERLRPWVRATAGGAIFPTDLHLDDDGDQVLRHLEGAHFNITFTNLGITRDSAEVHFPNYNWFSGLVEGAPSGHIALDPDSSTVYPLTALGLHDVEPNSRPFTVEVGHLSRTFVIPVGNPDFLAVNGAAPGDLPYDPDVGYYLPEGRLDWTHAASDTLSATALGNFRTLYWRAAYALPTPGERDAIASFLDAGGNLLLTGGGGTLAQWAHRSEQDSLFFVNYLGITNVADVGDSIAGMDVEFEVIDANAFTGAGSRGRSLGTAEWPVRRIEVMGTTADSAYTVVLRLEHPGTGAAPKLPHTVVGLGVERTYNAIVLGFDHAQIVPALATYHALRAAFDWLETPTAIQGEASSIRKDELRIGAWPNPFNSRTTIAVRGLEVGSTASVTVVAATGQTVVRRHVVPTGDSLLVPWDGRDDSGRSLGSGTYLVTVTQRVGATVRRSVTRVSLLR